MRPYHIRQYIVAASISATITVLLLKGFGYLSSGHLPSNTVKFTTISTAQPLGLGSPSSTLKINCKNGYALIEHINDSSQTTLLADQYKHPIKCIP